MPDYAQALVASPDVDLVVVTVKVPHHHALVTAALAAGKHVYCEWPLGNGLEEARELADLAEARGVGWGAMTDAAHAYLYDVDNGATLLSIPLGHTLAGFRDVLGGFRHLSARLLNRRQTVDVTDTGTTIPTTTPDQVLVQGTLDSGAAFSW